MKIGLSFVTLSAAALALSAGAAQARSVVGAGQAAANAQAVAAETWYQAEAHFFEGMNKSQIQQLRHQFQHQTSQRSFRPNEVAGVHGVAP